MTMELSTVRVVRKPWGRSNLRPWSELGHDGSPIGELWFQRNDKDTLESDLLLKLLFTDEPLSIQVHPDDAFAEYVGLAHGKTEAWYVLSAEQNSQIALGLKPLRLAPLGQVAGDLGETDEIAPGIEDPVDNDDAPRSDCHLAGCAIPPALADPLHAHGGDSGPAALLGDRRRCRKSRSVVR